MSERGFPLAGPEVGGLRVRGHVPNQDSIEASISGDYDVLPGIRAVRMDALDPEYQEAMRPSARVRDLASKIKASGEINPLIVAVDEQGPYILEGGHRYDALIVLKAEVFPAMVVLEEDAVSRYGNPASGGDDPDLAGIDLEAFDRELAEILGPVSASCHLREGWLDEWDPSVEAHVVRIEHGDPGAVLRGGLPVKGSE